MLIREVILTPDQCPPPSTETIAKAIEVSREHGQLSTIILRQGTFYLTETIHIGPQDNDLKIMNY